MHSLRCMDEKIADLTCENTVTWFYRKICIKLRESSTQPTACIIIPLKCENEYSNARHALSVIDIGIILQQY